MTITTNQYNVLNAIAHHEMAPMNGSTPSRFEDCGSTFLWADDFAGPDNLSEQQVGGVISSLLKDGMVNVEEWDDEDNVIAITQAGFDAWQSRHSEMASA